MRTRILSALVMLVLAASVPAGAAVRFGFGGGGGTALGDRFGIGALEMFAEMKGEQWLSSRFGLCFLPPLLPAEAGALVLSLGARVGYGDTVRPFLAVSGGAVIEPVPFRGFVPSLAWGVTGGLEIWISPSFGFYVAASMTVSHRQRSGTTAMYPYFPWTLGFFISEPRAHSGGRTRVAEPGP